MAQKGALCMRTFGILANCDKPTAPETLRRIERKAGPLDNAAHQRKAVGMDA